MGDPRLTYVGFSYGTLLGQTYANLFPRRVRAMVLDGVVDAVAWTRGAEARTENVVATPELSLKPMQWCFPVAGCVNYRGYYSKDEAHAFARDLRAKGHDVEVGGVPAYSTLGWFSDPLISTFIRSRGHRWR